MWIFILDTAPKVLNIAALQTMGTAAGGGAALTPVFSALGQAIKQHPKVKNDWLRWILPLLAIIFGIGILVAEVKAGYQVDPLTAFLFLGMFLVGAVGADAAYNLLKETPVLPAGPNNHPADASASQSITIQTPTTTQITSVIPHDAAITNNGGDTSVSTEKPVGATTGASTTIPESPPKPAIPSLPPSPFHP